MGLSEPVIPPFPISDYGTGVMGAVAALTGIYQRTANGGSWHGKVSLMQYDLLLFRVGLYDADVQERLRNKQAKDFFKLRHNHSVDQVSGTVIHQMREQYPWLFDESLYREGWTSKGWGAYVSVINPVVAIEGLEMSFKRASRPNGTDKPGWKFVEEDTRLL